jgi:hypothetical protein
MMEYFKNLYSNKLENMEGMDQFLDAVDLPKLNSQNINHLNRPIIINDVEVGIVSQQKKKPRT